MAGDDTGETDDESVTLHINQTAAKQDLLLTELKQLSERETALKEDNLTIDYLHDKQSKSNQIFSRAQENHAILISVLSKERQAELDYFKKEIWKKICLEFEAFEKMSDEKLSTLYKQRDTQRETQREILMQHALARDFEMGPSCHYSPRGQLSAPPNVFQTPWQFGGICLPEYPLPTFSGDYKSWLL